MKDVEAIEMWANAGTHLRKPMLLTLARNASDHFVPELTSFFIHIFIYLFIFSKIAFENDNDNPKKSKSGRIRLRKMIAHKKLVSRLLGEPLEDNKISS